jgi:ribosome-associated translation inhibitor RaiA
MQDVMTVPVQITYRDVTPSAALEEVIRERASKLDHVTHGAASCRVVVEAPNKAGQRKKTEVQVRVDLTTDGDEIVVTREPSADPYAAIRDAFDVVQRKLVERKPRS